MRWSRASTHRLSALERSPSQKTKCAVRSNAEGGTEVELLQQVVGPGGRTSLKVKFGLPPEFIDRFLVFLWSDVVLHPYVVRFALRPMRDAFTDEEFAPGRRLAGIRPTSPSVSIKPWSSLSYQYKVWAICGGGTSSGCSFRSTNDCASLTNAAVSRPPVPIRKPRRESMKKPSKLHTHLEGWTTYCCPFGPHRRATVAGQGWLAGPKPSLDAKG